MEALALYLLLACAADAEGLSFYGDGRTAQLLGMEPAAVAGARAELLRLGLILYRKPLYQLLDLPEAPAVVRPVEPCRRPSCAPSQRRSPQRASPVPVPVPVPVPSSEPAEAPRRAFPLRATVERLLSKGGAA